MGFKRESIAMMMITRSVYTHLVSILRRAVCFLYWTPLLLVVSGIVFCPEAGAQATAHFSGIQSTLLGGLGNAQGVAVDASRNLYITDTNNNRVLMLPWTGSGYGAQSTLVSGLGGPQGIAVDGSGNLYISDTNNMQVLKETLSGGSYSASTVASNASGGLVGPVGVAVDGSGNVYIADYATNKVYKETLSGGTYTQSTIGSGLSGPTGVAVDGGGNVYIAGYDSMQAYKETLSGGTYTQSPIGSGILFPTGIAVDGSGNVYISDVVMGRVVEEPWTGSGYGTQFTLAGGQIGPYGVAVDGSGNVYFADIWSGAVQEFTPSAGNFGAVNIGSRSLAPVSLIFSFDTGGTIASPAVLTQGMAGLDFADSATGSCTSNGSSHAYAAGDTCSVDVAFTPANAGTRYGGVTLENSLGTVIATGYVYGTGTGPQVVFLPSVVSNLGSGLFEPHGLQADASGNLYVADTGANEILEIPAAGGYATIQVLGGGFSQPRGVAVDGAGNVFVGDGGNAKVKEIPLGCTSSACVMTLASSFAFIDPFGVAVDGSGNVFVNDYGASKVYEIPAAGGYTTVQRLASSFSFAGPYGIAVDANANVFLADESNNAVREIVAAGGYTTVNTLGSGFSVPRDVAVDGSGNVYVADGGHFAVKEILAPGGYTTVQTLSSGYTSTPEGVAVDGAGNLYQAIDGLTYLIKDGYSGAPAFTFESTNLGSTSGDSPQSVTLLNNGNAPLLIPLPASNANNPGFSTSSYTLAGTSTCPVVNAGGEAGGLAVGASCTYAVDFAPAIAGTNSDALVLTDNNLNAAGPGYTVQSISLSGFGAAPPPPPQTTPTITWAPPTAINYGSDLSSILNAAANTAGSFTYTAALGSGPATAVTTASTLEPGNYTLTALFTPTDLIDYTTATALVPLAVSSNFGAGVIGSPSATAMTLTFTLTGALGNGTLASPLVLTGGAPGLDFSDAATGSCTAGTNYSSGVTCTVNVTFTPKYAGTRNGAVVLEDSSGTMVATGYMSGTGMGPQVNFLPGTQSAVTTSTLSWPQGIAVDASGNLYIADTDHARVLKETLAGGNYSESVIGNGLLSSPGGIALDGANNLYVADYTAGAVYKETPSGSTYTQGMIINGLNSPEGVAVDGSGNVYIADTYNSQVLELEWTGNGYAAPETIANSARYGLLNPYGVAVDGSGNVYIADTFNSQVLQLPWTGSGYGTANTVANSTANGLAYPFNVAVDGTGNVYIADYGNGRVLKETPSGSSYAQSTISSGLNGPEGVAADAGGNVYLTNSGVNVVWKEDFADAPALTFATPTKVGSTDAADGAQAVTVENAGNAALTFSGLSYPSDFPESGGSDCSLSTPLAAGASCPLTAHFVPASSGPIVDTLVLNDNSLNNSSSTQSIAMNGTGVPAFAKYGFAGLPSSLALGTPQLFTLTAENSGGATLTGYTGTSQLSSSDRNAVFSLTGGGAAIASYTFTPADAGVRSLYVTFETAGSQSITATDASAGVTTSSGGVLLSQTTPTITWPTPSAIGYGVALSSTQLNATASVAGTFAYTPAAGSVLNAGTEKLSVLFTPADAIDYSTASKTVSLTVNKATASVTPNPGTKVYGATDPVLSGTLSGFVASDDVSATYSRVVGETVAGGPYTISATLSPAGVLGNYNIAYSTANFTITKATLTATAGNASMFYGASVPSLTGTLVGVVPGDGITARYTTAATSQSPIGTYPITPVPSDPNRKLGNYNEVLTPGTLTIGTDTTTTTVQSSALTVLANNNVTFTAKVSSAVSTPAGSISFKDGGTALGTATLDNTGSATLTLATLSVGAHPITAVYEGNTDFVGSTSSPITETVQNFNFTIGGTTTTLVSATVPPGSAAVYTLQLSPMSGSTLAGAVALTLTGVPAGASYTVTPSVIAEGSGSTTVTVTVNIPKQQPSASSSSPKDGDGFPKPWLMVIFLPLLGTRKLRAAVRLQLKSPMLMLVMLGALLLIGVTACGSGRGPSAQPVQNYAMTLTGTGGGLQHSVTLNLTVQ